MPGEENPLNNKVTRLVNVEARKPRILYFEGEPRWEYKFIRRALDDYPDIGIELPACCAPRRTRSTARASKDCARNWKTAFRPSPKSCSPFQGLIIGSVEANYFTPTQQQLIRDFVDRRGGGLLFIGGRASLSDGG